MRNLIKAALRIPGLNKIENFSIRTKLNTGFALIIISMFAVIIMSFSTISGTLVKQESKSMHETIKQTKNIFRVYMEEIEKFSLSISRDDELTSLVTELDACEDEMKAVRLQNEIKQVLNRFVLTRNDIASMIVLTNNQKASIYGNQSLENVDINKHSVINDFLQSEVNSKWYDTYVEEIDTIRADSAKVIVIARKMYRSTSLKSVGTLLLFIKESSFNDLLKDINLDYGSKIIVSGQNNNIVLNPLNRDESGTIINKELKDDNKYNFNQRIYQKVKSNGEGYLTENSMLITFSTIESIASTPLKWNIVSLTEVDKITSTINSETLKVIWISLICLILGAVLSFFIAKNISDRIKILVEEMEEVKKGNLSIKVEEHRNDEIGFLTNSFSGMIESIKNLIVSIKNASSVASTSSQSLSSTCQQSYAFTEEMFSMANMALDLMDKLVIEVESEKKNIANICEIASDAKSNLNSIDSTIFEFRELSEVNNSAVITLSDMSKKIKNAMTGISTTIKELADASSQIVKITQNICEMSSETKLLALNATIESAKISSKVITNTDSFNVVSSEIRKLSDKFKISASEINGIIKSIVCRIKDADSSVKELEKVMRETDFSISDVKKNIENNNSCITKTVKLNTDLHTFIEDIKGLSDLIVNSINLIDSSSIEVLDNVKNIVKAHNEQVEMSRFLVEESEKLYSLSEELTSTTKAFNV